MRKKIPGTNRIRMSLRLLAPLLALAFADQLKGTALVAAFVEIFRRKPGF